jgi:hypothetical protein
MNGNNRRATGRTTKKNVTPFLSDSNESALFKEGQEFLAGEDGEFRHTAIR